MLDHSDIVQITEGSTRMLVPRGAMTLNAPPKNPAFFNPRARISRDLSVIAYAAFVRDHDGPRVFLEGLSGLGALGLRAANEVRGLERVVLNDLNPGALELAGRSAALNGLENVELSRDDACRFFGRFSRTGERGMITDVDPFGSPAGFLDCAARATMHGGMLSATATDLQVLGGLFDSACRRRYGGSAIRAKFGSEVAVRLILGCLRHITGRLDMEFRPLFVQRDQHYYRVFVRMSNRPDQAENMGFVFYCVSCGGRGIIQHRMSACSVCGGTVELAGPLWTGSLFDAGFLGRMGEEAARRAVDRACQKIIAKCSLEAGMPGTYHTLDETASRDGVSPPSLREMIGMLRDGGFCASPTSFDPTGFRTDADTGQIRGLLAQVSQAGKV